MPQILTEMNYKEQLRLLVKGAGGDDTVNVLDVVKNPFYFRS